VDEICLLVILVAQWGVCVCVCVCGVCAVCVHARVPMCPLKHALHCMYILFIYIYTFMHIHA